jgi:hypothetical protein
MDIDQQCGQGGDQGAGHLYLPLLSPAAENMSKGNNNSSRPVRASLDSLTAFLLSGLSGMMRLA